MSIDVRSVGVCLSPALMPYSHLKDDQIIIVADILRMSTSICVAFDHGVVAVHPAATVRDAKMLQSRGFLLAGERGGRKLPFADYGNSPEEFMTPELAGRKLAYTTTNGTQALIRAAERSPWVLIGSFLNLPLICKWAGEKGKDVMVLCAGWKKQFSLEDAFYAGALVECLMNSHRYQIACDAAIACFTLWMAGKADPVAFVRRGMHPGRLRAAGQKDVINFALLTGTSGALPSWNGNEIIDISKSGQ
ncbi:MAG: 2-phosphosulfolactate phosphatase [Bacteroidales bacterium]|nr:2-phosphosulfolactate phosphatase [Bacteroidales bacterium]